MAGGWSDRVCIVGLVERGRSGSIKGPTLGATGGSTYQARPTARRRRRRRVPTVRHPELEGFLREERELVYAFGGYAFQIAGGTLVVDERIPVPRFNYVGDVAVARSRMSGFLERALDHYYQRALRPEFHLPEPPPAYLADTLGRYGFHPRAELRSLLLHRRSVPPPPAPEDFVVRPARSTELDTVVDFWAATREREELRRSLEVLLEHPNPEESLLPVLALSGPTAVAAALLHEHRGRWGIHLVATQPGARGRGAATTLVAAALARWVPASVPAVGIWADHGRIRRRLEAVGFHEIARWRVFELDPKAELTLPPVAASTGPHWRPPRAATAARPD